MDDLSSKDKSLVALCNKEKPHLATIGITTADITGYKETFWLTESMAASYVISYKHVRKAVSGFPDDEATFFYNLLIFAVNNEWIFNLESLKRASRIAYLYINKKK